MTSLAEATQRLLAASVGQRLGRRAKFPSGGDAFWSCPESGTSCQALGQRRLLQALIRINSNCKPIQRFYSDTSTVALTQFENTFSCGMSFFQQHALRLERLELLLDILPTTVISL